MTLTRNITFKPQVEVETRSVWYQLFDTDGERVKVRVPIGDLRHKASHDRLANNPTDQDLADLYRDVIEAAAVKKYDRGEWHSENLLRLVELKADDF